MASKKRKRPVNEEHTLSNPVHVIVPDSHKMLSLTSSTLEHWFATLEKDINESTQADSSLSTQFLARFGLTNTQQVIEFLNSPEGKSTLTMITQELIKLEFLNDLQAKHYREGVLLELKNIFYLLMALAAKEKEYEKQVREITQQQNEKVLKDTKSSIDKANAQQTSSVSPVETTVSAYNKAIIALDKQIKYTQHNLQKVNDELLVIDDEEGQIKEYDDSLNGYLDKLNEYLNLPNTPQDAEQTVQKLIENIQEQTTELTKVNQKTPHQEYDMEGLRLQERGLHHALHVLRKEKFCLNDRLEQVNDFSNAYFIFDPDRSIEKDWVHTLFNVYHQYHQDEVQRKFDAWQERRQKQTDLKDEFLNRINVMQAKKLELNQAKIRLLQTVHEAPTPKPTPKQAKETSTTLQLRPKPTPPAEENSYLKMIHRLGTNLAPEQQPKLHDLIGEVTPGRRMQLGWLYGSPQLIPGTFSPKPEFDLTQDNKFSK